MKYIHVKTGAVDHDEDWILSYDGVEMEARGVPAQDAFAEDVKSGLLVALDETHERIIFDNAGGCTLQLYGWAHFYQDSDDAIEDVAKWIRDEDTSEWEGHDDFALSLEVYDDDVRNGKYQIFDIKDLLPPEDYSRPWWDNVVKFKYDLEYAIADKKLMSLMDIEKINPGDIKYLIKNLLIPDDIDLDTKEWRMVHADDGELLYRSKEYGLVIYSQAEPCLYSVVRQCYTIQAPNINNQKIEQPKSKRTL